MSAARLLDSLRYGATLVGYLLVVALVSAGAIGGGAVLAVPGRVGLDAAAVGTGRLAGGIALGVLGAVVFLGGLVGLAHKLVADAVSAGVEHGVPAPEPRDVTASGDATGADQSTTDASEAGSDRSTADRELTDHAPAATDDGPSTPGSDAGATETATADAPAAATDADSSESTRDSPAAGAEEPPAPSPEEIVFGSSDEAGPGERAGSASGVGSGGSEDPLADPSDET